MLNVKKIVGDFISKQPKGNFDPNISAQSYRLGIDLYIASADKNYYASGGHIPSDIAIHDAKITTNKGTLSVRYYESIMARSKGNYLPCIIYFTGTGFVYSNPNWQIRNCIDLAYKTGAMVINPQEKNAPEYPFPSGLNECFSLIKWLFTNAQSIGIDISNIYLCGFSSGGNFSAVLARWCAQFGYPIKAHYLISPWLDLRCNHPSYDQFAKGYLLDKPVFFWLRKQYASVNQFENPDVSPVLYGGSLKGLSPCHIIVGECEAVKDECIVYREKIRLQHIPVNIYIIPGQIHEYCGCNRWQLTSQQDDPINITSSLIPNNQYPPYKPSIMTEQTNDSNQLSRWKSELSFFNQLKKEHLMNNRHLNADMQHEYDKQFGIVLKN